MINLGLFTLGLLAGIYLYGFLKARTFPDRIFNVSMFIVFCVLALFIGL